MIARVAALGGVILQQMREHLGAGQVVDGDDFVALSAEHLTESETTDAAESINSNLNRHDKNLLTNQVHSGPKVPQFTDTILPHLA